MLVFGRGVILFCPTKPGVAAVDVTISLTWSTKFGIKDISNGFSMSGNKSPLKDTADNWSDIDSIIPCACS